MAIKQKSAAKSSSAAKRPATKTATKTAAKPAKKSAKKAGTERADKAANKPAQKGVTKRSSSVKPRRPELPFPFPRHCTLEQLCAYVRLLSRYLLDPNAPVSFIRDYTALRIAVCNVEKQAFSGTGDPNKPPRFCTGGSGTEPAAPPAIPIFT